MLSFFIYKIKLPGHVLENLHLLTDFCTVDYPMPDNPKRAILYRRSSAGGGGEDENCNRRNSSVSEEELKVRQELGRRLSNHAVPSLQIPKEEYPSVLVVEANNTNGVILRYERTTCANVLPDAFPFQNLSMLFSPCPSGTLVRVTPRPRSPWRMR